ncbi:MAG: VOC family protein [Rhodobacterales bacterium]|nr:VOC family protein [Rhodobacterales bacterium]
MPIASLLDTLTLAISVRDRHASAEWYRDMLGFELIQHIDEAGWSEMKTNSKGVTLGLGEHAEPAQGTTVTVFGVVNVELARRALEAEGVRFEGETAVTEGMVSTAIFHDPDGNVLMLAQDLTGGN